MLRSKKTKQQPKNPPSHPDGLRQQRKSKIRHWNASQITVTVTVHDPQGPHSQILMTGGSDRGSYFIPKKITTSEFVYPKKSVLSLAYPEKSLWFFLRPKKIPASFIDPKNPLRAKISDPKKSLGPSLSLKCVSGAPGSRSLLQLQSVCGSPLPNETKCHSAEP